MRCTDLRTTACTYGCRPGSSRTYIVTRIQYSAVCTVLGNSVSANRSTVIRIRSAGRQKKCTFEGGSGIKASVGPIPIAYSRWWVVGVRLEGAVAGRGGGRRCCCLTDTLASAGGALGVVALCSVAGVEGGRREGVAEADEGRECTARRCGCGAEAGSMGAGVFEGVRR